jgi:PAS domain S-box-containing protein
MGWEPAFWMLFRHSSSPMALLDSERRVADVNEAFLGLLGRSRLELVGSSIVDVISPPERSTAAAQWQTLMARGGEYTGTRHLIRADGSLGEVEFAARRIASKAQRRLAVYVVLARSGAWPSPARVTPPERPLTERERQVITLIALGRGTRAIASELYISPATVRTHVRNAMSKLGAHTRAQLVAAALCSGGLALHPPLLGGADRG